MTIEDFFNSNSFHKSLIVGYYGGGNYGDELLLEVISIMLHSKKEAGVTIGSINPGNYKTYHKDYGFKVVNIKSLPQLLGAVLKNKNIIIGGGGHWGVDFNPSIFILSAILYVAAVLLRKKVYLIGVGYYSSTSKLGHIAARLSAKASQYIICRDQETLKNFSRYTEHLSIDKDIAWRLPDLTLGSYEAETRQLAKRLRISDKTIILSPRRFKPGLAANYMKLLELYVTQNPEQQITILMMEPRTVDSETYTRALDWQKQSDNLTVLDFSYNPVCLFLLFKTYHLNIAVIAPQFHVILTAILTDTPYLPFAYDNKVAELLQAQHVDFININDLQPSRLQAFTHTYNKRVS